MTVETVTDILQGMPDTARVWVYQADRFLTSEEIEKIGSLSDAFVRSWESHGHKLSAASVLLHKLFLIIAVDENIHDASGCSIDKSVGLVKEIGKITGLNFFDRTVVAYTNNDRTIEFVKLADIKKSIENGHITLETHIFNNLNDTLGGLRRKWLIPAKESWLSRFF